MLHKIRAWIKRRDDIVSAVVFGSNARRRGILGKPDRWSDIDLHVVTVDVAALTKVDWGAAFPQNQLCLCVARPASGGVQKVTAVFETFQIDLVLVPEKQLTIVEQAISNAVYPRDAGLTAALNEMATCLHSGFHFIKGEGRWGDFYRTVYKLPGVRIDDALVRTLADSFLCDLLWILQKLERGELIAAQHSLHTKLVDTNLRLWRETELRRGTPIISFGLGRRLEEMHLESTVKMLRVSANASYGDLHRAAAKALETLINLTRELLPEWRIGPNMGKLIDKMFL